MPTGDFPSWAPWANPIQFYPPQPSQTFNTIAVKANPAAKANPNRFRLLQAVFILSRMQEGKIVAVNYVAEGDVEVLVRLPGGAERVFFGNELEWNADEYGERWLVK